MIHNWYVKYSISRQLLIEAGWKENIATGLMAAIIMVLSGSTVEAASKKTKVPETTISNAMENKELVRNIKNTNKGMSMQSSDKTEGAIDVYEMIKQHEGCKEYVYKDTRGILSIGIGFNLEKEGARKMIEAVGANYDKIIAGKQSLTDNQIKMLFNNDMKVAIADAKAAVKNFNSLPQKAQAVLIDMAFNLGGNKLMKFEKMRAALEIKDYNEVAKQMKDSHWYTQVGNRSKNLIAIMKSLI